MATTIERVEWAPFEAPRPRAAGCNSQLPVHGAAARCPIARITTSDGATGFGPARATAETATMLLGARVDDLIAPARGVDARFLPDPAVFDASVLTLEFPIWDLAAKRAGQSVAVFAAAIVGAAMPTQPLRVRCYDTSLYIDDLHLTDHAAGAALIAAEAREGYERGHRAFKIKVGRGARHMALEAGTLRDIAVIRAVRAAVGPNCPIMIDANNGYNLNLTKRVLAETADCQVYWMEEAFHENPVLYEDLRNWLNSQGIATLIADGEGVAAPILMDWARDGLVDVIQYDILRPGFSRWIDIGRSLDAWQVRAAPHHYGGYFGNFTSGHLASFVRGFEFVEWDEASTPAVDHSRYQVRDGWVELPSAPGFGLDLDDQVFRRAVAERGFTVAR